MDHPHNAFKHAIARRATHADRAVRSSRAARSRPRSCRIRGFDWLLIDTEHSPNELPDVLAQLQAVQAGTASAIVRPAWNDIVLIKRFLDIGAQTLLMPCSLQTPDEARRAVLEATRYPPGGIREHHRQRPRQPLRPGMIDYLKEREPRNLPAGAGRDQERA